MTATSFPVFRRLKKRLETVALLPICSAQHSNADWRRHGLANVFVKSSHLAVFTEWAARNIKLETEASFAIIIKDQFSCFDFTCAVGDILLAAFVLFVRLEFETMEEHMEMLRKGKGPSRHKHDIYLQLSVFWCAERRHAGPTRTTSDLVACAHEQRLPSSSEPHNTSPIFSFSLSRSSCSSPPAHLPQSCALPHPRSRFAMIEVARARLLVRVHTFTLILAVLQLNWRLAITVVDVMTTCFAFQFWQFSHAFVSEMLWVNGAERMKVVLAYPMEAALATATTVSMEVG